MGLDKYLKEVISDDFSMKKQEYRIAKLKVQSEFENTKFTNDPDLNVLQDAINARSDAIAPRLVYDGTSNDGSDGSGGGDITKEDEEVSKGLPTGPVLMS